MDFLDFDAFGAIVVDLGRLNSQSRGLERKFPSAQRDDQLERDDELSRAQVLSLIVQSKRLCNSTEHKEESVLQLQRFLEELPKLQVAQDCYREQYDSGTLASELVFGAASALLLCNDGSRQNCVLGTLDRCLAYYRQMDAEAFDISAVRVTLQALVKAISQTTPRFDNESLLFLLEMEVPSIAATPPRTSQMSLAESLSSEPAGSPRSIDLETAQLSALAAVFWSAADADLLWNALIGRPAQLPKSFLSDKQHERIKQISGALIDKLGSSSHGNLRPAHIKLATLLAIVAGFTHAQEALQALLDTSSSLQASCVTEACKIIFNSFANDTDTLFTQLCLLDRTTSHSTADIQHLRTAIESCAAAQTGSPDLITFSDCMEALKDHQEADLTENVPVGKMGQRMPFEVILLKATVLLANSESNPESIEHLYGALMTALSGSPGRDTLELASACLAPRLTTSLYSELLDQNLHMLGQDKALIQHHIFRWKCFVCSVHLNTAQATDLLAKMLSNFVKVGSVVLEQLTSSKTQEFQAQLHYLAQLLPLMNQLAKRCSSASDSLAELFLEFALVHAILFEQEWLDIALDECPFLIEKLPRISPASLTSFQWTISLYKYHDSMLNICAPLGTAYPHCRNSFKALENTELPLLCAIFHLEDARSRTGLMSTIPYYADFGATASIEFAACIQAVMDYAHAIAMDTVQRDVTLHRLHESVYDEMQRLCIACCDPHAGIRKSAANLMSTLANRFPSLLCNLPLMTVMLELLTLLRRACENLHLDQYSPTFIFRSARASIDIYLPEDGRLKEIILTDFYRQVKSWLIAAASDTPVECQGLLQTYIKATDEPYTFQETEMGRSLAVDLARLSTMGSKYAGMPHWGGWKPDSSTLFASTFASRRYFDGVSSQLNTPVSAQAKERLTRPAAAEDLKNDPAAFKHLLYECAASLIRQKEVDFDLLHYIVSIPVQIFTAASVTAGLEAWSWVVEQRPALEYKIMTEIHVAWGWTMRRRFGLFSNILKAEHPFMRETEYSPSDLQATTQTCRLAETTLRPHALLLQFLASRFHSYKHKDGQLVVMARRVALRMVSGWKRWCSHPLAQELRLSLLLFAYNVMQSSAMSSVAGQKARAVLYSAAFSLFRPTAAWSYGGNRAQMQAEYEATASLYHAVHQSGWEWAHLPASTTDAIDIAKEPHSDSAVESERKLLLFFLESNMDKLRVWLNPLSSEKGFARRPHSTDLLPHIRAAWHVDPELAFQVRARGNQMSAALESELKSLVHHDLRRALMATEYAGLLVRGGSAQDNLRYLVYAKPMPPVLAIKLFLPRFASNSLYLQYALRVLEERPIAQTFFYVPQIVQGLRTDPEEYIERFVFEAASVSQLFCHQIIWNMKANCFKDDNAEIADPMKPKFENMIDLVVRSLSGEARNFYEREFAFFNEVTSISRKLQPFIKKSKPEKKAKIDEEMGKIALDVGVYLPSNPDGVVVDIDRKAGRPLQSHAKAPFMAKFKVRKEKREQGSIDGSSEPRITSVEVWLSAIFKVGDDCRQDMLALQLIAQFKNIFLLCGLDLYLNPYRVTSTGPGMGIIDVVPDSTSRDEMGRNGVVDLPTYFKDTFGDEMSSRHQAARWNFIRSSAAYSLVCYILQIKDRHNGNIMIDADGHVVHIDFGFLFDIGPGGIKFEPSSFKLTHEMVNVMGGLESSGYRIFRELTVKAFLSCRTHQEELCATAQLMMGTDLPSFKGIGTIDRLRERFRPELSDSEAAEYMQGIIENAQFSSRSILYDRFQKQTNSIPYAR